ncbi:methyltransferase domain-containing protein [Eubacteriales bacterium OttesenSCG-928-M02]|nr:methyltransferase domain-containing protein [Eubacteriales bacterium OttesenSCG-928-M02]
MKPIINWQELQSLNRPPMRPPERELPEGHTSVWDASADMYKQMAAMEQSYTLNQINCFDTDPTDTVLDIGCGPGRITVPMAQRAKSVTSIDTSEYMMNHCRANVAAAGLDNVTVRHLDWMEAEVGKNLEKHDIVIACRSVGLTDIEKLASFSNKYCVLIAWANSDCIPDILWDLFQGVDGREDPARGAMFRDRRVGYNTVWNTVYDLGFDPNIRIVRDGFTKDFASAEEAYADLAQLGTVVPDKMDMFRKNVDRYLTKNPDGSITFRRETRSYVMWFEPVKK